MTYLPKGRVRFPFLAALPGALLVAVLPSCTEPTPAGNEPSAQRQQSPARADTVAGRVQVLGADCGLFPAAARMERALRTLPLHRVPVLTGSRILPSYPFLIHQNLPRYKRQYFGFYNLQRQPDRYVQFFAESVEAHPGYTPRWLREAFQVVDGGAGFWSIKYNWSTHQSYDFETNSEG